jgi:mono/diheme cytochrome c family protein
MVKPLALVLVVAAAVWAGVSTNHGLQDLIHSNTKLLYPNIRDMRRSVVILPQKTSLRAPDSLSVPITGREVMPSQDALMSSRDAIAARYHNPTAVDDSSLARGERMFSRLCVPCHGKSMMGDGPVAAKFMPPPDLLKAQTRTRSDGFIYTYIRFGGVIMPKYGQALTQAETWDVINYVRHQQQVSPR